MLILLLFLLLSVFVWSQKVTGEDLRSPRLLARKIFKFLASLQCAIVLLTVIIVATAAGTIYETSFNADVAQKYIYGAPWFNLWLTILCVNLYCVAAIRYPWKRHQTGFVITHAGIITLLVGAMIDRMWGIEGFIHLHANKAGTSTMELHQQELRVKIGDKVASTYFKLNTLWNERPAESPDKNVTIEIKDVSPVRQTEIATAAPASEKNAKPGLNFTLQGPMMGRHDGSIFLDESDNLGPATIVFVAGMPPDSSAKQNAVEASAELAVTFQGKSFKYVLKSEENKVADLDGLPGWKIDIKGYYPNFILGPKGPATRDKRPVRPAAYFELIGPEVAGVVEPASDPHGQVAIKQDSKNAPQREKFFVFTHETPLMAIPVHGASTGATATLTVSDGASDSSDIPSPNGVAFYLGSDHKLRYLIKHTPRRAMQSEDGEAAAIEKTGEVELEKSVSVGWAPGAEFVVHESLESAKRKLVFIPKPELKEIKDQENVNQGIKVRATIGNQNAEMWVGQTDNERPYQQELDVAGTKVIFEFVNQTVTIPFTVSLKKFSAPRDEGSNEFAAYEAILGFDGRQDTVWLKPGTPMALARNATMMMGTIFDESDDAIEFLPKLNPRVTIESKDIVRLDEQSEKSDINPGFDGKQDTVWLKSDSVPAKQLGTTKVSGLVLGKSADSLSFMVKQVMIEKKDIERSDKLTQKISMNRPTTFPVSWWGPYLGTCYKFSQANHRIIPGDPRNSDPNYSGVQVLRDPGWLLKWVGCIMICFGIFTMFYLRPYFNRPKVAAPKVSMQAMAAVPAFAVGSEAKKKTKKK